MSVKIRDRLAELSGDVLEWFTEEDPMAGRHFVTAAIGTQQVRVGHRVANAHWNLTWHRFAVDRVVGT
jgi:hypothetical protein